MRILDKKSISRRSFLKGGTATALGLTIAGNMVLGKSSAWAASFDNLGVQAVKNAKAGQVQYRTDKAGIIHCTIGQASFDVAALKTNLVALIEALNRAKPSSSKGVYLRKVAISTTMGPGIRVDTQNLLQAQQG